ncbi:Telomeric repeat-binding factor 2 [Orobanche minor]
MATSNPEGNEFNDSSDNSDYRLKQNIISIVLRYSQVIQGLPSYDYDTILQVLSKYTDNIDLGLLHQYDPQTLATSLLLLICKQLKIYDDGRQLISRYHQERWDSCIAALEGPSQETDETVPELEQQETVSIEPVPDPKQQKTVPIEQNFLDWASASAPASPQEDQPDENLALGLTLAPPLVNHAEPVQQENLAVALPLVHPGEPLQEDLALGLALVQHVEPVQHEDLALALVHPVEALHPPVLVQQEGGPPAAVAQQPAGQRRARTPFSIAELTNLVTGLEHFGVGHWSEILEHYFHNAQPPRTDVDLKDKWKTLKHTVMNVSPDDRIGESRLIDEVLSGRIMVLIGGGGGGGGGGRGGGRGGGGGRGRGGRGRGGGRRGGRRGRG